MSSTAPLLIKFLYLFCIIFLWSGMLLATPSATVAANNLPGATELEQIEQQGLGSRTTSGDPVDESTIGRVDFAALMRSLYTTLSRLVLIASILAGVIGGYIYMTSSGNPEKIGLAKEIVAGAIFGLVAIAFAYTFFQIISPDTVNSIKE